MTHARLLTALALACSLNLFAQYPENPISIDPPDPTSNDSVTLTVEQFDSCPPPPVVTRSGFDIRVTVKFGMCMFPPSLIRHRLELGPLPSGRYNVTVAYEERAAVTYSFLVRDANSTVVVAQAIGSTAGGTVVDLVVAAAHCLNQPSSSCPPPAIIFGGAAATNVVVFDQSHFRATTPLHAAGAVEVTVVGETFSKSSYAFRYVDLTAAPSEKFYEKVLLPVVFNGAGAFGSNWVTELSLRNDNAYVVEPWRPIGGASPIYPSKPLQFGSGNAPAGLFLVIPRQAAGRVAFHAAVRETSRALMEWATELPIVREEQFSNAGVDLLDIPVSPRYRTMLRIYTPTNPVAGYAAFVHVIVYSLDDGTSLRDFYVTLTDAGCTDPVSCAEHPSYGAVGDVTAGLAGSRVGIQLQAAVPLWAFATVTNNETQHVTVISPH